MSHGITHNDSMFSVREMPWHGLGVVLDEYPRSIDEALEKSGLGWKVTHGDVLVVKTAGMDRRLRHQAPGRADPGQRGSRPTCARTPARCSGSSPTNTRSSTTATRSDSSTR